MGGGCILDLGCYLTSFMQVIFKENKNLTFKEKKRSMSYKKVEVDARVSLLYNNEVSSELHCSFKENLPQKVKIQGTSGNITITNLWSCESATLEINNSAITYNKVFKKPFSYQINSINNCITNKNFSFKGKLYGQYCSIRNTSLLENWMN